LRIEQKDDQHAAWVEYRILGGVVVMRGVLKPFCIGALFLLAAPPVIAQQKNAPAAAQKAAPAPQQAPQPQTAEERAWAEISKLEWQNGPSQGDIAGKATIAVPKGSVFLSSAGTRRFLELQGNLGDTTSYTFAPSDLEWFSVFGFNASGYVQDDEKIDPDALLEIMKKSNVAGNEERKKRGLETLVLEDWYVAPHYDVQTKRLEWGTRLRQESGGITVNYTIRLLGRSGVMSVILVSSPTSLDRDVKSFKAALAGFGFNTGEKYSEFRSGDKVAEYGLAALIVGGAAAAAAKSGALSFSGSLLASAS
jgi:uncharacterized membrane-anchored protein